MSYERTCPGSGKPVYIDYGGALGNYPVCPECRRVVGYDRWYNTVTHVATREVTE